MYTKIHGFLGGSLSVAIQQGSICDQKAARQYKLPVFRSDSSAGRQTEGVRELLAEVPS